MKKQECKHVYDSINRSNFGVDTCLACSETKLETILKYQQKVKNKFNKLFKKGTK